MIRERTITVEDADANSRLDRFVVQRTGSPRSLVLEALAAGRIRLNGRRAGKGDSLKAGDRVLIEELPEMDDVRVRPDAAVPVTVIYADAELLAVDKPAGLPVHPLRLEEIGTLANGLVARHPEMAALGDRPLMAGLVHRIDTDTSGVVLAARTAAAFAALRDQFRRHDVRKTYLALVHGLVPSPGEIRSHLVHDPTDRGRMVVLPDEPSERGGRGSSRSAPTGPSARRRRRLEGEKPLLAVTAYQPVRQFPSPGPACTLLEVTIYTGVTHQIRCQLAAQGHPIVGDRTYGPAGPLDALLTRHFLHAAAIAFRHPSRGEHVRFESPLPAELMAFVTHISS